MSPTNFKQPNPWDETTWLQQCGFAILFGFTGVALLVSCLRIYSRISTKTFGLDDALIIIAMILSVAHTTASYMYMKYAYIGFHVEDIPWNDPEVSRIWMYIINVVYNPILAIVKMSVLIFLLRLGGYKTGVRRTILAVGAVNLLMMIGCLLAMIFQCFPFEYNWRPWAVDGTCINQPAYYVARAVLNVITDIVVLIVPIWIFWDLKVNKKVRWALIFVFMLGFM
ncbi:hypothetical protein ACKVWC_010648 [Pyricularia oryzae]